MYSIEQAARDEDWNQCATSLFVALSNLNQEDEEIYLLKNEIIRYSKYFDDLHKTQYQKIFISHDFEDLEIVNRIYHEISDDDEKFGEESDVHFSLAIEAYRNALRYRNDLGVVLINIAAGIVAVTFSHKLNALAYYSGRYNDSELRARKIAISRWTDISDEIARLAAAYGINRKDLYRMEKIEPSLLEALVNRQFLPLNPAIRKPTPKPDGPTHRK